MNFDQGAKFISYTFAELCVKTSHPCSLNTYLTIAAMDAEIDRRERVMCGDRRVATPGERLRLSKANILLSQHMSTKVTA